MSRLIVALDTDNLALASAWARVTAPHAGMFKVGLELFTRFGPMVCRVSEIRPLFLDLKFHDIPSTVAKAVSAVLPLMPRALTLHAAGGKRMIAAAREVVDNECSDGPLLLAVVLLSSQVSGLSSVMRAADVALEAGADGLVCPPGFVRHLRSRFGLSVKLVVPGIRPAGSADDDHVGAMTPRQAIDVGADWIVVGRPITGAASPAEAAATIVREIS